MFTPRELALERGWPGRIDGDRVVQLAAQTLQAFFTGGGAAREHAEYRLAEVDLRPPVLRPPAVRLFAGREFVFGNPAAIYGPDDEVAYPHGTRTLRFGLGPESTLDEAHARASAIEEQIRRERPDIADVIVHTEP